MRIIPAKTGGAGRLEIEFYSTQDLDRIYDAIMSRSESGTAATAAGNTRNCTNRYQPRRSTAQPLFQGDLPPSGDDKLRLYSNKRTFPTVFLATFRTSVLASDFAKTHQSSPAITLGFDCRNLRLVYLVVRLILADESKYREFPVLILSWPLYSAA